MTWKCFRLLDEVFIAWSGSAMGLKVQRGEGTGFESTGSHMTGNNGYIFGNSYPIFQ